MSPPRPTAPGPRRSLPATSACLAILLIPPGCTADPAAPDAPNVIAAPRALHFTPAHPELPLHLLHHGERPLPLARIRIDPRERDWTAFTITDASFPRQIAPNSQAILHLRVDVDHFKTADPHTYRSGEATLALSIDGQPRRISLRFAPEGTPPVVQAIRLALLAALAAALTLLARARHRRLPWPIALPALVALAILPLGSGLCPDALTATLTASDLLQCADGRGGTPLQIFPHPDGLGLLLAALLFSACGRISGPTAPLRRALGLTLAVLAFVVHFGLDPMAAVQAQSGMHWGLWMQPFAAAALAIAAATEVQAARAHSPLAGHVAALGLAALLITLCLGGPTLPEAVHLAMPHAAATTLGLVFATLEVIAIALLLTRLRPPVWARRSVLPLALLQIFLALAALRGAASP